MTALFLFALLCITCQVVFGADGRYLCYTGSVLYQNTIEDCAAKNPSYDGTWYCAKMEVCENFISPFRECIYTRGCATEEQCTTGGGTYDSTSVKASNNATFAGMKITTSCCVAESYADDDSTAIDYSTICNSGTVSRMLSFVSVAVLIVAFIYLVV